MFQPTNNVVGDLVNQKQPVSDACAFFLTCQSTDSFSTKRYLQGNLKPNEPRNLSKWLTGVWQILPFWLGFTIRLPWVWVYVASYVWCLNCLMCSGWKEPFPGLSAYQSAFQNSSAYFLQQASVFLSMNKSLLSTYSSTEHCESTHNQVFETALFVSQAFNCRLMRLCTEIGKVTSQLATACWERKKLLQRKGEGVHWSDSLGI